MIELSADNVKNLFDYDQGTGVLTWKMRSAAFFQTQRAHSVWNARYAGHVAFTATRSAPQRRTRYYHGRVFNKVYQAHRVIWLWVHGEWPDVIDHINGDGLDNRIENLRNVSTAENMRNMRRKKNNTTGANGVSAAKKGGWRARLTVDRKEIQFGTFQTISDAAFAVEVAKRKLGFHPTHGSRV